MFYVPVNSSDQVGTLPPLYWTFTQNEDVMTSNKCLKYNHPTKPQRRFDLKPLFLGKLRPERLTSNLMVSQQRTSFAWRQSSPSISLGPYGRGPKFRIYEEKESLMSRIMRKPKNNGFRTGPTQTKLYEQRG